MEKNIQECKTSVETLPQEPNGILEKVKVQDFMHEADGKMQIVSNLLLKLKNVLFLLLTPAVTP